MVAPEPSTAAPARRLAAIDATRGAAMFFVCLSHFADGWYGGAGEWDSPQRLGVQVFTRVAAPTFMLVSGTMLGFLKDGPRWKSLREKLIDRALFLLIAGHLLISLAEYPLARDPLRALLLVRITDAIGFSIVAGCVLVELVGARGRGLLAVALLLACWLAGAGGGEEQGWLRGALFGRSELAPFALLPWLAVYLAGSALGSALARRPWEIERMFWKYGAAAMAAGIALSLGWLWFRRAGPIGWDTPSGYLLHLLSPLNKQPPSLAYLLFYGGLGLGIAALFFRLVAKGRARRAIEALALVGRNSLVAFVLQFYVYYTAIVVLPIPREVPAALVFLLSLAAVWLPLRFWDRLPFNKSVLTVGYPWRRSALRAGRQGA